MLWGAPTAKIVLASASPRRRELLSSVGLSFDVTVSNVDETPKAGELPQGMVERLALAKAQAVATGLDDAWVIGADTDVVVDGAILGKPRDESDAERMLSTLQGRVHDVWGGYAIVNKKRGVQFVASCLSGVEMMPLTLLQIRAYIKSGEPMDKAGAYAIQGIGAALIRKVRGSYTNVVGLPLSEVMSSLEQLGALK